MWVEILPARVAPEDEEPIWDIQKKPPQEFEVRLVVWDTVDIKMMDWEGTSDVFIRSFFDNNNALETDCHYRCQDGKASFNYRLLFRESLPRKDYRLTIQAFDRDFFKSNDIIGSASIDLKQAMEDAEITKRLLAVNKEYFTKYMKTDEVNYDFKDEQSFWVPIVGKNEDGVLENTGKIRI
jgi:Ca2+-dependent lipid-binding protein